MNRFLAAYAEDRERDSVQPLGAYLSRHPGKEEEIAREYIRLKDSEEGPESERGRIGPYHVLEILGQGAQGVVYLAQDTRLPRRVALKVLKGLGPGSEKLLRRHRREAEIAARLDHPGICSVLDTGIDAGTAWIAMRFVEGETLSRKVASARAAAGPGHPSTLQLNSDTGEAETDDESLPTPSGPDTEREMGSVLRLIERTARALHVAHDAGIIHRDIKPGNIMVTPQGEPVILDFGLARDVEGDDATLTLTGDLFGTPAYMSPEQLLAKRVTLDRRTDVYSLGVTLFECLTLHRPFDAPTREGLYQAIQTKTAPDPRTHNRAIPSDLRVIIETAIEKDRDRRYQTALDLAEDLRRLREHEPIKAKPVSSFGRLVRWARRNRAVAALAGALFASLILGLAVSIGLYLNALQEKDRANGNALEAQRNLDAFYALVDLGYLQRLEEESRRPISIGTGSEERLKESLVLGRHMASRQRTVEYALEELRNSISLQLDNTVTAEFIRSARFRGLTDLLTRLRSFSESNADAPGIARMEKQWSFIQSLHRRTVVDYTVEWQECLERVTRSNKYPPGTLTSPIVGLIPLGADPESDLEEFAETAGGDTPVRNDKGQLRFRPDSALVFVMVPGGSFAMGAQRNERSDRNFDPSATPYEEPVHEVTLAPFLVSKYEMTQGQWQRITGENPSTYAPGRTPAGTTYGGGRTVTLQHPVEGITWESARSILENLGMQLPTEAQWEYACRAGTSTVFSTGNSTAGLLEYANIADAGSAEHYPLGTSLEPDYDDGEPAHCPVDRFKPNAFGLHNVLGNVWEICLDFLVSYETPTRAADGLRVGTTPGSIKVCRGGSYMARASACRSAHREMFAGGGTPVHGVRPVIALKRQ